MRGDEQGVGLVGWLVDDQGLWTVYLYIDGTLHAVRGEHWIESWLDEIPQGLMKPAEIVIVGE